MLDRNITGQTFVDDINTYNKNKYQVRFSNFPNFTGKTVDMNIFNLYIQSITIPDISIPMLHSMYMHEDQRHPNPIGDRELQTVTITFQVSENQQNWYAFYAWIVFMRHGQTCGKTNLKGEELLRMDCIDTIDVLNFNNKNQLISKMTFGHCILNNVSSMELQFSTSEIGTFTVTFEVETIDLDLMTDDE
jgi:hypothetical protein